MAVRTTVDEFGVAVVRLDDPDRRNALSEPVVEGLAAAADRSDVSVFVLTGSGGFFSAGADVEQLRSGAWLGPEPAGPPTVFRRMTEDPRPWVAAVNGPAIGGGCELALSCDVVLMADDAFLSLPEASLGVLPNTAVMLLRRTMPHPVVVPFLLGLERIGAARAVELGLATRAVAGGDLDAEALGLATRLRSNVAPTAFGLVKRAVREGAWEEATLMLSRVDRSEMTEGIDAMLAKTRNDYAAHWDARRLGGTAR